MQLIVTIFLWVFLAIEVISILEGLASGSKPRQRPTPEVSCLAGGVLLACTLPVVLILIGDYPDTARYLAGWLGLTVAGAVLNLARETHGARGERTALATFLYALLGLFNISVILYLLLEVL